MQQILNLISFGGIAMYPLIILAIIALALICDKFLVYKRLIKFPKNLVDTIETYEFSWQDLEKKLSELPEANLCRKFFNVILSNNKKPAWWVESRSSDEAMVIQKQLGSGLWALETIVTVAPLLGLFGTIIGMMNSFKLIGGDGLVNPTGVTSGVAEALIATAFGLVIAMFSLFAFNYFSKLQDQSLDELERLGTRMIDHIRLDQNANN